MSGGFAALFFFVFFFCSGWTCLRPPWAPSRARGGDARQPCQVCVDVDGPGPVHRPGPTGLQIFMSRPVAGPGVGGLGGWGGLGGVGWGGVGWVGWLGWVGGGGWVGGVGWVLPSAIFFLEGGGGQRPSQFCSLFPPPPQIHQFGGVG